MKLDLFPALVADAGCTLLGARGNDFCIQTRTGQYLVLPVNEVEAHPAHQLARLLKGERGLRCMAWMSRIVGYFSLMHNWNPSKHRELADRHEGDYGVPAKLAAPARTGGLRFPEV